MADASTQIAILDSKMFSLGGKHYRPCHPRFQYIVTSGYVDEVVGMS